MEERAFDAMFGAMESAQLVMELLLLVPVVCGCILVIMVVWLICRHRMNEAKRRHQLVLAAIEKNSDMDIEELLKKVAPKQKMLKERQLTKLQWGSVSSLVGLVFIGYGAYLGYVGGYDADDPVVATVFGVIILAVGIAFLFNYFVGKKMLAKEMEAEERQQTQQA